MAEPIVIVGNTVAAAVAAERFAARGECVRWLHPDIPFGAGFRQATVGGRSVNFGPRLLELSYVGGECAGVLPKWSAYKAGHDGHRPWQTLVARYLLDLAQGETRAVRTPELWWRSVRGPDVYFTGDLRALTRFLDARTLTAVAQETARVLATAPAGGVHHDGSDLGKLELTAASLANHGATFHHALIEVLARRLRGGGTAGVSAALHNKLWIPLYWPRTLWEAAASQPIAYMPNRSFQVDVSGGMSALIENLESRLAASPLVVGERVAPVASIASDGKHTTLSFADGLVVTTDRVVLGSAPEELFAAAGLSYTPDRLKLRLVWIEVAERDLMGDAPSVLTVADSASSVYRVSAAGNDARAGHQLYTIELAEGHPEPDITALGLELERVGFLRSASAPVEVGRRSLRAFVDPTIDGRRQFDQALGVLHERLGQIPIVGPAAGFGADPLNEQIFQGIRIAEVFP